MTYVQYITMVHPLNKVNSAMPMWRVFLTCCNMPVYACLKKKVEKLNVESLYLFYYIYLFIYFEGGFFFKHDF